MLSRVKHQNWSQTNATILLPKKVMWPNSELKEREINSRESNYKAICPRCMTYKGCRIETTDMNNLTYLMSMETQD